MEDRPPNAEDYASVRAAVGEGGSLNGLVEGWELFVSIVEDEYDDDSSEYLNDVRVRGELERVRAAVTPFVRASLDERLRPLDARFRAATEPWGTRDGQDWWMRVPRRPGPQLAASLGGRRGNEPAAGDEGGVRGET